MIKCPTCQVEHPENAPFCHECGSYLLEGNRKETDLMAAAEVTWMEREETCEAAEKEITSPLALKLTIPGSERDVEMPLTKEMNIGRRDPTSAWFPDVDLTIDGGLEKGISRRHAKITRRGSEVFIEDLGSMNRTFLNHKKLTPYLPEVLKSGDELQLGKLILRVSFTK
jgi:hypothetical protein